jgi:hypothetical protein
VIKLVEGYKDWIINNPYSKRTIVDFLREQEAEFGREMDETYQRGLDDGRDAIMKSGDYMRRPDYEEAKKKILLEFVTYERRLGSHPEHGAFAHQILKALGIEPAKPGKEKG